MRFFLPLFAFLLVPAQATVIYSNLGPGDSHSSLRYGVDGEGYLAFQFQVSQQAVLTSFRAVLGHDRPGTGVWGQLFSGTPTAMTVLLESYVVTPTTSTGAVETIASAAHPTLNVGTTYWLAIGETGAPDSLSTLWWMNNQSHWALLLREPGTDVEGWVGALEVNGQVTDAPEPGVGLMAFTGLLALGAARRRVRHSA